MRSSPLFVLAFILPVAACGQFDYGLSGGGVFEKLHGRDDGDLHASTEVGSVKELTYSVAAFYRERYSDFVDLGLDLTLVHRSFNASYGDFGLGGGVSQNANAELDQLYFGVKPEVRMDAKRYAVVRFGVMLGFRIGGSAKGTYSKWSVMGPGTLIDNADLTRDFGGDMRFAFGFGFRVPVGQRWAVTIDPEATVAFTSMLKKSTGMRGSDIGMRIGLSRRSNRKSLSTFFKSDREKREPASIWD